jgi:SHS2 domain-containing protein
LAEVNRQLQRQGLQVSSSAGAILDATLIISAAWPRKSVEGVTTGEEPEFMLVDAVHGAIHRVHTTPENVAEIISLEAALILSAPAIVSPRYI